MIRLFALAVLIAIIWMWLKPPGRLARATRDRIRTVAIILVALLYVGSPVDLIPDLTPIGLVDDAAVLVTAIWWARKLLSRLDPGEGEPEAAIEVWDPYEVLGVVRGASEAEITHAYRSQLKQYHPDRVADLGGELQRVAHEKTILIQRAYRELTDARR